MRAGRLWREGLAALVVSIVLGCGPGTGALIVGLSASGSDSDGGGGPGRLTAPDGVTVTLGSGELTVQWLPVKGATSYNIYWDTTPGVTPDVGRILPDVTSPYLHTGLVNGQSHYYVVTALKGTRLGPESAEVEGIPLAPPANVVALPGDSRVTLSWTPIPGVPTYGIYWDISPGVTRSTGTPILGVSPGYVHSGLTNGTAYYYVVTAVTPLGESGESAEVSATPSLLGAGADIGGTPVTFSNSWHYYDVGFDISGIYLAGSSPAGWTVNLWWEFNLNPGCPFDSCSDWFFVDVTTPTGGWYWEEGCTHQMDLCITQYAAAPGGTTAGTFSGEVVNVDPPFDTMTVANGQFSVLRQ